MVCCDVSWRRNKCNFGFSVVCAGQSLCVASVLCQVYAHSRSDATCQLVVPSLKLSTTGSRTSRLPQLECASVDSFRHHLIPSPFPEVLLVLSSSAETVLIWAYSQREFRVCWNYLTEIWLVFSRYETAFRTQEPGYFAPYLFAF